MTWCPPATPPTDAERALWQSQLTEAELTLHRLMTGQVVNKIKLVDREIENNAANQGQLRMWINELRARLGLPLSGPPRTPARRILFR